MLKSPHFCASRNDLSRFQKTNSWNPFVNITFFVLVLPQPFSREIIKSKLKKLSIRHFQIERNINSNWRSREGIRNREHDTRVPEWISVIPWPERFPFLFLLSTNERPNYLLPTFERICVRIGPINKFVQLKS